MNRQQKRKAERLLLKGRFPFPELQNWLRGFLRENPEVFAQVTEDATVTTNLSGEVEVLDVTEFRELLLATKEAYEKNESRNQADTGETRNP